MNLIQLYHSKQIKLSRTEEHILMKIDLNINEIDNFTITSLAEFCNTSTTSLNRLVKKLDFKNYQEFKLFIHDMTKPNLENISHYALEQHIFNFFRFFDSTLIDKLVEDLHQYSQINLVGVGQTRECVNYFSNSLLRIKKQVFTFTESHLINNLHTIASNNSIFIFISSSGNTKTLLEEIKILHDLNLPIVSITSNPYGKIQKYCTYNLNLPTVKFETDHYDVYSQSIFYILIDILINSYYHKYLYKK